MRRKAESRSSPGGTPTSSGFQETSDGCFRLLSIGCFDLLDVIRLTYPSPCFGLEDKNQEKTHISTSGKIASPGETSAYGSIREREVDRAPSAMKAQLPSKLHPPEQSLFPPEHIPEGRDAITFR